MTKLQKKAAEICDVLDTLYPEALCSLQYDKPYELMIATRLSAQCTDARVNIVTRDLFKQYPTLDSFADAELSVLEQAVHPCGFYKAKAKSIKEMCQRVRDDFGGVVPDSIEALTTLPGVGRKTANLIVGDVYGQPAVVADTHLIRISNRLGLVGTKDPVKVEFALRELLPPEDSNDYCHRNVLHGRAVCDARKPKCEICPMKDFCAYAAEIKVKS